MTHTWVTTPLQEGHHCMVSAQYLLVSRPELFHQKDGVNKFLLNQDREASQLHYEMCCISRIISD